MKDLINYTNWLKKQNFSNKTIQIYTEGVRHFGNNSLNLTNLNEFFQKKVQKLAANTIIARKTALKSYAKFKKLHLGWEKIARLIPKVQKQFFATINQQELERLKQAKIERQTKLYQRNNLLLDFLFYSGLRVSELANLKHSDYQNNNLRIHGKGNKVRYIFLPPFLTKHLNPYSSDYLFTTNQGKPLTKDLISLIVRRKTQKAGIPKRITPHTFRRSLATNLYNRGGRLETIQKQLGHSNIQTTLSYIHNDYNTLYADYSKLWKSPHLTTYE